MISFSQRIENAQVSTRGRVTRFIGLALPESETDRALQKVGSVKGKEK